MSDKKFYKYVQTKHIEDKILTIKLSAKEVVEIISMHGTGSIDSIKEKINRQIDTFADFVIEQIKKINE